MWCGYMSDLQDAESFKQCLSASDAINSTGFTAKAYGTRHSVKPSHWSLFLVHFGIPADLAS